MEHNAAEMDADPPRPAGPTPSQTVGPFFGFALPFVGDHMAVAADAPGAIRVEGQVVDGEGAPVADAVLEIWQGDQFGRCCTDPEGAFRFVVTKPPPGPSGQAPHLTLRAQPDDARRGRRR